MSESLAKRPTKSTKLAKRGAKPADTPVEIKTTAQTDQPTTGFGELAQTVVTGAEGQADQLARLEVEAFAGQIQRNAPVVAQAKADIAATVFSEMSGVWGEAMAIVPSEADEVSPVTNEVV